MAEKLNKRGDRRGLDDHKRNTEKITTLAKLYREEVAGYKEYVEDKKRRRKYSQEMVGEAYNKILAYTDDCYKKKQPLTVAGVRLAIGILQDAWIRARDGDLDYLLEEYIVDNNIQEQDIYYDDDNLPWYDGDNGPVLLLPWSYLRKKADLLIQDQLERNCYTNKGNPAGSIFGLKAQFGWQEDNGPQHLVQQLVIADLDQAKKALAMLK